MNQTVREDLIAIYSETVRIIEAGEYKRLAEVSNHTVHNASIFQDEDSISAAVVVYALSKLTQHYDVDQEIIDHIKRAIGLLKQTNLGEYNHEIKEVVRKIKETDGKLTHYIQEVIDEAEIKKGSKLYDQGISLARASQLLGVSQWDLMAYVGKTKINDRNQGIDQKVKDRIQLTREIFSL